MRGVLILLLAAVACGGPELDPVAIDAIAVADPMWHVTEFGIGPIRVGMTIGEAEAATGAFGAEANGCTYAAWPDAPPGVAVMVEDGRVARVDVESGTVPTGSGVRIGDTEARVLSMYEGRVTVGPHKYTAGHYLTVRPFDPAHLIVFETEGGRVLRYRAGLRHAVEYVEHCG
jgi:hypothetical protein